MMGKILNFILFYLSLFLFNFLAKLFTGFAKPSFFVLIIVNTPEEILFSKIWPINIQKLQFGIGDLPQEKIADPHLAAGSDE